MAAAVTTTGSFLTWLCEPEGATGHQRGVLRLVLVAYFPPSGSGLMVPIFVQGDRLYADSQLYRVSSPAELDEFVAFYLKQEGFSCSGPYSVAPPALRKDPSVVLAMHAVLLQRMGKEKAIARLTPVGEYEGVTPHGRFRWVGTPSQEDPSRVDVRLLWSSLGAPMSRRSERIIEFSMGLPPELAELQLLVAGALLLSPYEESWRPLGHHALEGRLVPPPEISVN